MEGAIGALFFLVVLGLIAAVCYRYRDGLKNWLDGVERRPSDPKLEELKEKVGIAKSDLKRYQKRLELQDEIKDAQRELDEIEAKEKEKR